MSDDDEVQKLLRKALAEMPVTIESGVLDPKASATKRLKWVELAIRIFQGPSGRPITDDDAENKRKAAEILKAAVPELEKIRDEHQSARLRSTAAQYLLFIAKGMESGN
jgi:hypothetical protein